MYVYISFFKIITASFFAFTNKKVQISMNDTYVLIHNVMRVLLLVIAVCYILQVNNYYVYSRIEREIAIIYCIYKSFSINTSMINLYFSKN